jgi:RNA polymerase sigma-70 factor (ECF subfamily)
MNTHEDVTRLILKHRKVLFAYIHAIVRDASWAEDLFQDVSMVILRRWEEFGEVRDFWALARETARRQSLAALRERHRSPVLLSAAALDALDRGFDAVAGESQAREEALHRCVQALPPAWQELVRFRYWMELSVGEVAARSAKSENTVSVTLNRIRSRLADCVRRKLGHSEEPWTLTNETT